MTHNIKKITPEEYSDYYKIRTEALTNNPEAFGMSLEEASAIEPQSYREKIATDDRGAIFLCYDEAKKPRAMVGVQREKGIKREHIAMIWGMYVSPELRGQKIGYRLLKEAISFAEKVKIEKLYLHVNTENKAAFGLYTKLGFQCCGTEKNALKLGDKYFDEYLLEMFL